MIMAAGTLHAQRPVRLVLSQPSVNDTLVRVMLSVQDEQGNPMQSLKNATIGATYGAATASAVRLSSYADAKWGMDVHLLMDVSQSISEQSLNQMREVARLLSKNLGKHDRLAISTIGSRGHSLLPLTKDTVKIQKALAALVRSDSATNLHRALLDALDAAGVVDTTAFRRKVVIVMSDGLDDATATMTDAETTNRIKQSGFQVFALGYEGRTSKGVSLEGISHLGVLARAGGGDVIDARMIRSDSLAAVLLTRLKGVHLLEATCRDYGTPGSVQHLGVTCTLNGIVVQAGLDVRSLPGRPAPLKDEPKWPYYLVASAVILLVGAAFTHWSRRPRATALARGAVSVEASTNAGDMGRVITSTNVPPVITIRIEPARGAEQLLPREYVMKDRLVLGRDTRSDYPLIRDPHVSGRHAELQREEAAVMIMDLQSTNGTRLNGVPVLGRMRVQDGDTIGLGSTELRIFISVAHDARTMS